MGSSRYTQLVATVRRNLLIKRRDASHTIQEVLLPVRLWLSLSFVFNVMVPA